MATHDEPLRMDETHKRLLDWTYGQPPSERLAAQILDDAGYEDIDPSHPLGGPDGGCDGECTRDGETGVWAVYFPRGQQTLKEIEDKLKADIAAARKHNPEFLAFVTNQELRRSWRGQFRAHGGDIRIDLIHLERVATILDRPRMAPVREQFLRIPAIRSEPASEVVDQVALSIAAAVVGSAHMFTGDTEVLELLVRGREARIRQRSDEGHERVRAEHEAKKRAEQERLAREAREAVAKAQRDRLDAAIPKRPWDVGVNFPRPMDILNQGGLLDSVARQYRTTVPRLPGMPRPEPSEPPEPLCDDQIEAKVAMFRAELQSRWPSCRNYLAGVAWPALRCRITNEARSFLTDVEVVLTFHGAQGVDFENYDDFEVRKFQDPSWVPRGDPYHPSISHVLRDVRPSDYPFDWRHNDDGDLQVTITLPRLRPLSEWRGDEYGEDIVLIVDPGNVDSIEVTYTATAHGYGDVFEGEPIAVPVAKAPMFDVLRQVMEANKPS